MLDATVPFEFDVRSLALDVMASSSQVRNQTAEPAQPPSASALDQTAQINASTEVANLRDRLLREARQERLRCLDIARAAERWREELGATRHMAVQTEPVVIRDAASTRAAGVSGTTANVWDENDEAAQARAMKTLQTLSQRGFVSNQRSRRAAELEELIRAERAGSEELDALVQQEKKRREAAQQQVLTLENEMDAKEATLQNAQLLLERRDGEVQQAQWDLQQFEMAAGHGSRTPVSPSQRGLGSGALSTRPLNERLPAAPLDAMQMHVMEQDRKLELKDQLISHLMGELKQTDGVRGSFIINQDMERPNVTSSVQDGHSRDGRGQQFRGTFPQRGSSNPDGDAYTQAFARPGACSQPGGTQSVELHMASSRAHSVRR